MAKNLRARNLNDPVMLIFIMCLANQRNSSIGATIAAAARRTPIVLLLCDFGTNHDER